MQQRLEQLTVLTKCSCRTEVSDQLISLVHVCAGIHTLSKQRWNIPYTFRLNQTERNLNLLSFLKNSLTCSLFQDRGQHHMLNYPNFNLIHHIIRNSFRSHHKKGKLKLSKQKTLSLNSLFVHGIHAQYVCGQMRNLFNSLWVKYWKLSNVLLLFLLYLYIFQYDFDSFNH